MKTPRDILLGRHQAAEVKLDGIRRDVLAAELGTARAPAEDHRGPATNWLAVLWLQLVWPARRTWLGLAAVWVCILTLHVLSGGDHHPSTPSPRARRPSPEVMALLREQQQLRAELLGIEPAASVGRSDFVPRPHSENTPWRMDAAEFRLTVPEPGAQMV